MRFDPDVITPYYSVSSPVFHTMMSSTGEAPLLALAKRLETVKSGLMGPIGSHAHRFSK